MHCKYCLLDTVIDSSHRYGIAAVEEGCILDAILDLSLDREPVVKLVMLCNKLTLDLIHLSEVVEDFFVVWE